MAFIFGRVSLYPLWQLSLNGLLTLIKRDKYKGLSTHFCSPITLHADTIGLIDVVTHLGITFIPLV